MDVRQFTQEGTYAAAVAELPRLKDLGIDILWLSDRRADSDSLEAFDAAARKLGMRTVIAWNYSESFDHDVRLGRSFYSLTKDPVLDSAAVSALSAFVISEASRYPDPARAIFYTEDRSDVTAEGLGKLEDNMAMLSFTLPQGYPMIAFGQDTTYDYKPLTTIRHQRPSLRQGDFTILEDQWVPDGVFAFTRSLKKEQVLVMANFTDTYLTCALPEEMKWEDAVSGEFLEDELICPVLEPWGWRILVRR